MNAYSTNLVCLQHAIGLSYGRITHLTWNSGFLYEWRVPWCIFKIKLNSGSSIKRLLINKRPLSFYFGFCLSSQGPIATAVVSGPQAPPPCGGPPPPPPGPPPPPAPAPRSSGSDDSASRSALFAQINQGEGITSGKWFNLLNSKGTQWWL